MDAGEALNETVGGAAFTVTVALAVVEPLLFLAVIVYEVVAVGDTLSEPLSGTLPMPWLMEAEVAPLDVQVRVEELPTKMVAGEAEIVTVGLAAWAGKNDSNRISKPAKKIHFFVCIDYFLLKGWKTKIMLPPAQK
jgi:hypothetical protein